MALYVTRPRRDEERIGRGLPNGAWPSFAQHYGTEHQAISFPPGHIHYVTYFLLKYTTMQKKMYKTSRVSRPDKG